VPSRHGDARQRKHKVRSNDSEGFGVSVRLPIRRGSSSAAEARHWPRRAVTRAAFHEAGHAVMIVAQGRHVRKAVLSLDSRPRQGGEVTEVGYVEFRLFKLERYDGSPRCEREARRSALVALAGVVAEGIWSRRYRENAILHGSDLSYVHAVLRLLADDDVRETTLWMSLMRRRASRILSQWWPAVDAVARVLEAEGSINGQRVRRLALAAVPFLTQFPKRMEDAVGRGWA